MHYLLKKKIDKDSILVIGNLQQEKEQLIEKLKHYLSKKKIESLLQTISNIRNPKRACEILFTHLLLNTVACEANVTEEGGIVVEKTISGKPVIKNGYISISHTVGIVAILVSNKYNTAVDIEFPRDQVTRITHKFMNDKEKFDVLKNSGMSKINLLTTYWCAKETMYKLYGKGKVDFTENIHITLSCDNGNIDGGGTLIFKGIKKHFPLYILQLKVPDEDDDLIVSCCLGSF